MGGVSQMGVEHCSRNLERLTTTTRARGGALLALTSASEPGPQFIRIGRLRDLRAETHSWVLLAKQTARCQFADARSYSYNLN